METGFTCYTDLFGHLRDENIPLAALRFQGMRLWTHAQRTRYHLAPRHIDLGRLLSDKKKSSKIFIFGSGYSINAITEPEWHEIQAHNTMSFNWFIYQKFVDIDYHVIRETFSYAVRISDLKEILDHYCGTILANPRYDACSFLVQSEYKATSGNAILGLGLLPPSRPIALFHTRTRSSKALPSERGADGIAHGPGTLTDCINFAILGGWTDICLVGVDLYDRRYFWLGYDQSSRGFTDDDRPLDHPHSTIKNGLVEYLGRWADWCAPRGIRLSVYNERSLLRERLPAYRAAGPASPGQGCLAP